MNTLKSWVEDIPTISVFIGELAAEIQRLKKSPLKDGRIYKIDDHQIMAKCGYNNA